MKTYSSINLRNIGLTKLELVLKIFNLLKYILILQEDKIVCSISQTCLTIEALSFLDGRGNA